MRRRQYRRGSRRWILWLIPFLCAAFALFLLETQIRPVAGEIASLELENRIAIQIDAACESYDKLRSMDDTEVISMQYDSSGKLIALTADMTTLNRLRNAVIAQVTEQINGTGREEIPIPLGTVLELPLLSGLGPDLTVEVLDFGGVGARFESTFKSTGINQTLHQIQLIVSGRALLMMPGGVMEKEISTAVTVAETVILGDVPESYAVLEHHDNAADSYAEEP